MSLPAWVSDSLQKQCKGDHFVTVFGYPDTDMNEAELRLALRACMRRQWEASEQHRKDMEFLSDLRKATP